MGANKKSSSKRELDLCPKFTTKDSHMSLPRSRSHNGPTNPRNKPQTISKRKHNSRSKGLSSPAKTLGGPSGTSERTVCVGTADRPRATADCPKNNPEPPVLHPQ
jgi:hypothetical protein